MQNLRLRESAIDSINRSDRDAGGTHERNPLVRISGPERGFQLGDQHRAVTIALRYQAEARIIEQFRSPQDAAHVLPHLLRVRGHRNLAAVPSLEATVSRQKV